MKQLLQMVDLERRGKMSEKEFKKIELLHNFNDYTYKYAFAAPVNNETIYTIPLNAKSILKYSIIDKSIFLIDSDTIEDFAYTGGAYDKKRNCIWGFPRNSDKILKIDVSGDNIEEIPLGLTFGSTGIHGGHHYSGVLYNDYIYCPPRHLSCGILKFNTHSYVTEILDIDSRLNINSHYSGSILHPNGNIYFTPSVNNFFICFNPINNNWETIGNKVDGSVFGGCVYDNDLICFTNKGILRIDVTSKRCEYIYMFEIEHRTYGLTLHSNGKIYAWTHRNQLLEYNPLSNQLRAVAHVYDYNNGCCFNTCGYMLNDGNIYFSTCQGRFFMRAVFE